MTLNPNKDIKEKQLILKFKISCQLIYFENLLVDRISYF
ncbi:hypothetical protein SAMN05444360_11513 [Chryseobacterium carnipullorum]|nr:hypothetical protein SAMN05444360_11513 [Chryseobacterium carnipullorum]